MICGVVDLPLTSSMLVYFLEIENTIVISFSTDVVLTLFCDNWAG